MGKRGFFCLFGILALFALWMDGSAAPFVTAGGGGMIQLPETPGTVALTFDDGPRPDTTTRLLDELALREIPATFFLVGEFIPENQELIRRMAREGHQIGVHSYSHRLLTGLKQEEFRYEVDQTREQLTDLLGEGNYWLRPPYGIIDPSVQEWAGSPVILWSLDSLDWEDRNTRRIVKDVLSNVKDGDIILFHDIYPTTVDAVVEIATTLQQQGWCFATVEQLLADRGIEPNNGQLIR